MGRAMTSETKKIAPLLPKQSKIMRPRQQKSIKKLAEQSNGHPKKQQTNVLSKTEPEGTVYLAQNQFCDYGR